MSKPSSITNPKRANLPTRYITRLLCSACRQGQEDGAKHCWPPHWRRSYPTRSSTKRPLDEILIEKPHGVVLRKPRTSSCFALVVDLPLGCYLGVRNLYSRYLLPRI